MTDDENIKFTDQINHMQKCLTVKKLKEIIKDWPEGTEEDPAEVWLGTKDGQHSNECMSAIRLNHIDLLLEPDSTS